MITAIIDTIQGDSGMLPPAPFYAYRTAAKLFLAFPLSAWYNIFASFPFVWNASGGARIHTRVENEIGKTDPARGG
jgi:hypothetical protein